MPERVRLPRAVFWSTVALLLFLAFWSALDYILPSRTEFCAENGVLDLPSWVPGDKVISLAGEWESTSASF